MLNKKKLLIGLGALGLVAVVGLAIGMNQGGLFKGALQSISFQSIKPLAVQTPALFPVGDTGPDYTADLSTSKQTLSTSIFSFNLKDPKTATITKYNMMGDSRLAAAITSVPSDVGAPTMNIDLSKIPADIDANSANKVYLKMQSQPASGAPYDYFNRPAAPIAFLPVAHASNPPYNAYLDPSNVMAIDLAQLSSSTYSQLQIYDPASVVLAQIPITVIKTWPPIIILPPAVACIPITHFGFSPATVAYDPAAPVTPGYASFSGQDLGNNIVGIPDGTSPACDPASLAAANLVDSNTEGLNIQVWDSTPKMIAQENVPKEAIATSAASPVSIFNGFLKLQESPIPSGRNILNFIHDFTLIGDIGGTEDITLGNTYTIKVKGAEAIDPVSGGPYSAGELQASPTLTTLAQYTMELKPNCTTVDHFAFNKASVTYDPNVAATVETTQLQAFKDASTPMDIPVNICSAPKGIFYELLDPTSAVVIADSRGYKNPDGFYFFKSFLHIDIDKTLDVANDFSLASTLGLTEGTYTVNLFRAVQDPAKPADPTAMVKDPATPIAFGSYTIKVLPLLKAAAPSPAVLTFSAVPNTTALYTNVNYVITAKLQDITNPASPIGGSGIVSVTTKTRPAGVDASTEKWVDGPNKPLDAQGVAVLKVTESVQGDYVFEVTTPGQTPIDLNVKFEDRYPSQTTSTLSATPTSLVLGSGPTTLTVTALSTDSQLLPNQKVVILRTSGGSSANPTSVTPATALTDASGKAQFKVNETVAGAYVYSAKFVDWNVTADQKANVTYTAPATSGGSSGGGTTIVNNYYTTSGDNSGNNNQQVATAPVTVPCVVNGRTLQLAQADSDYCKNLQQLPTVMKSDLAPTTPQARYTTAVAVKNMINDVIAKHNLSSRFRVKNLPTDWYKNYTDAKSIPTLSADEIKSIKDVVANGIIQGRKDASTGQATLAPLDRIKYIEVLALFRQAFTSVIGYTPSVSDSQLPAFALEYKNDPSKVWMYQAIQFGMEFNIFARDQYNAQSIQGYALRADMADFLVNFQNAIESDPSVLGSTVSK